MMPITVYKFGGAALVNAASMMQIAELVSSHHKAGKLFIVVSAMGKTTNAFEQIAEAQFDNKIAQANFVEAVRKQHLECATSLRGENQKQTIAEIERLFNKLNEKLDTLPYSEQTFDFLYDQIIPTGELLCSVLFCAFLREQHLEVDHLDARKLIRTDDKWREAAVDWMTTRLNLLKVIDESKQNTITVLQGFIGADSLGRQTTLGREGSDFSAAICAAVLDAQSVVLWKDVDAVYSADPREYDQALPIKHISYYEALQMANYGAKVIHPKTLQPLENKHIPLFVRSFLYPHRTGTIIDGNKENGGADLEYPPIIVRIKGLKLYSLSKADLSYLNEKDVNHIFELFERFKAKSYLMEIGMMKISVAVKPHRLFAHQLTEALSAHFRTQANENLELVTIRHYNPNIIKDLTKNMEVFVEQKSRQTMQLLLREIP